MPEEVSPKCRWREPSGVILHWRAGMGFLPPGAPAGDGLRQDGHCAEGVSHGQGTASRQRAADGPGGGARVAPGDGRRGQARSAPAAWCGSRFDIVIPPGSRPVQSPLLPAGAGGPDRARHRPPRFPHVHHSRSASPSAPEATYRMNHARPCAAVPRRPASWHLLALVARAAAPDRGVDVSGHGRGHVPAAQRRRSSPTGRTPAGGGRRSPANSTATSSPAAAPARRTRRAA